MKRRSFLQLIGLSPAIGAIPAVSVEAKPVTDTPIPQAQEAEESRYGMARYAMAYDINRDQLMCRLDVLLPDNTQIHCDTIVSSSKFDLAEVEPALLVLRNEIRGRGFAVADAWAPYAWQNGDLKFGYVALS